MFHRFSAYTLLLLVVVSPGRGAVFQNDPRKNWVVLAAGSNGWFNYRHQANVCHAYQLLRARGIPEENIITLMYDDIANNTANPFEGKIFNDYNHKDVYNGVIIDYRDLEVSAETFVRVLKGDPDLHNAGKKVLQSTSEDNVFIYFTDHGASGLIAFPDDDLTALELNKTINYMFKNKMYKQMVLYVEACESGSMFEQILSENIQVYVTTSTKPDEYGYAKFCADPDIDACLSDEYSYSWITDSESHDLHNWTLHDQYERVKIETERSEPQEYGDPEMKKLNLDQFQTHNFTSAFSTGEYSVLQKQTEHHLPSIHVRTHMLARRMMSAKSEEARQFNQRMLDRAFQLALLAESTVNEIVSHVRTIARPSTITDKSNQLQCFEQVYERFKTKCFTIQQVPELAPHLRKLNNLCGKGFKAVTLIQSIEIICG